MKVNYLLFGSALALLAGVTFTSCSSDDVAEGPVNPTFDGSTVKTQFAINVTAPSRTRMSDANTQNGSPMTYLGMNNVRLLTFATTPADGTALLSKLALSEPTDVNTSHSSHIYSDVNIPVTTNNFLFYSTRNNLGNDLATKAQTGSIVSDLLKPAFVASTTTNINFKSEEILSSTNTINAETTAFAQYLNNVKEAKTDANKYWKDCTDPTLAAAYNKFISIHNNQRAGSATAVKLQMQALYTVAKGIPLGNIGYDVAQALCKAILNNDGADTEVKFTESSGVLSYPTDASYKHISNFPCEQGLPEGAALLRWTGSTFEYVTDQVLGSGDNKVSASKITFPLPITYFDNTPVKANVAEISSWQATTGNWDAETTWSGWTDAVAATTRSIALKNNINYAVAGLKTLVKCEYAALEDNKSAIVAGTSNQSINVPTGGFAVTGIIIGGQPNEVNWQFVNTSADTRAYSVYDKETNGAKANTAANYSSCTPIYTLVFDNWTSKAEQEKVYFALELQNGDVEFYGQEGVIAAGQKFYLIGVLNPAAPAAGSEINWPTYPESYTGAVNTLPKSYEGRYPVKAGVNRVFVQDYTTTAQVNIKSLKNAYVTIPDLRATDLQLGLSVDLTWQNGLTFDVGID